MARELETDQERRAALDGARTIAVLGAHPEDHKPAHYVPAYLHEQGYRIVPVNPVFAGRQLFGETVRASLAEIEGGADLVDVFRRSGDLPAHVDDLLAMRPPPRVVWLQSGIRNDAVAARLREAGIDVVQDACTLVEHRRLGIGPRR